MFATVEHPISRGPSTTLLPNLAEALPPTLPTRGQHVQPGDVVRYPQRDQRRRVLSIAEVPGTIYYAGVWEHLDTPNRWREAFSLCFVAFYQVERAS